MRKFRHLIGLAATLTLPASPASAQQGLFHFQEATIAGISKMMMDAVVGCRVLVVEDETLIAVLIEDILGAMDCEIVGPTGKLETAVDLARDGVFDIAILDVTIRGGKIYPVAELLLARGIPFVLASGYGDWALPELLRHQRRLMKPFTSAELEEQVRLLCAEASSKKPDC